MNAPITSSPNSIFSANPDDNNFAIENDEKITPTTAARINPAEKFTGTKFSQNLNKNLINSNNTESLIPPTLSFTQEEVMDALGRLGMLDAPELAGDIEHYQKLHKQYETLLAFTKSGLNSEDYDGLHLSPGYISDTEKTIQLLIASGENEMSANLLDLMAMLAKIAQVLRDSAREMRTADLTSQIAELMSAADKIKEAAEKNYKAAKIQAVTQIVSGAVQVGMAGYSAKKIYSGSKANIKADSEMSIAKAQMKPDIKAAKAEVKITSANLEATEAQLNNVRTNSLTGAKTSDYSASNIEKVNIDRDAVNKAKLNLDAIKENLQPLETALQDAAKITSIGHMSQGLGHAAGGIGSAAASAFSASTTKEAGEAHAAQAKIEAGAKIFDQAVQDDNQRMQQAKELLDSVTNILRSVLQALVETNRGMIKA